MCRHLAALLTAIAAVMTATSCGQQTILTEDVTVDVLLPTTPVKDQGNSSTGWIYAMLATIETEHLLRGDSVNLSAVYVRRAITQHSDSIKALSTASKTPSTASSAGEGASQCQQLLSIIGKHGIVAYDQLPDDSTDDLRTPLWVFMYGMKYSPQEFAHSVCAPGEYCVFTIKGDYAIEETGTKRVPTGTLRSRIDRAAGSHPVCWEGNSHSMCIIGKAHDGNTHYYILKDSHGADAPNGGLVYMPEDELWQQARAVCLTRDAYEKQ